MTLWLVSALGIRRGLAFLEAVWVVGRCPGGDGRGRGAAGLEVLPLPLVSPNRDLHRPSQ